MGMGDMSKGIGDVISHMILPCLCLASTPMATFARTIRSSMVEDPEQRLRALPAGQRREEWKVICLHSLKNALPPLVTVLGLQIAGTFTGAIITEASSPGLAWEP